MLTPPVNNTRPSTTSILRWSRRLTTPMLKRFRHGAIGLNMWTSQPALRMASNIASCASQLPTAS